MDIAEITSRHRDLVTRCSFGFNITEWAQSIFPSRGRTNPGLDTYASTYPIGIPKRHLSYHPVTVWTLMQSKHLPEIAITYDLTV